MTKKIDLTQTRQDVADRLNRGLKLKQLSGNQLAANLNLPKSTISNWRSGKRAIPSDRIAVLCNQLAISPDVLLCGESYDPALLLDNDAIKLLRWFLGHNKSAQLQILEFIEMFSTFEQNIIKTQDTLILEEEECES